MKMATRTSGQEANTIGQGFRFEVGHFFNFQRIGASIVGSCLKENKLERIWLANRFPAGLCFLFI
jgi:hypothetical protein